MPRKVTACLLLILAATGITLKGWLFKREPVRYEGWTVPEWFYIASGSTSKGWLYNLRFYCSAPETNALRALKAMGPQAESFLVVQLSRQDSAMQSFYLSLYRKMPQWTRLLMPSPTTRSGPRHLAAKILARIGPDNEETIAAVVTALNDPDPEVAADAAMALGRIPRKLDHVDRALIRSSMGGSAAVQVRAVQSLIAIGGANASVRLAIEQARSSEMPYVRIGSSGSYESIDVSWKPVPALISDLQRPNEIQRLDALRALANYGPGGKSALPVLLRLANEKLAIPTGLLRSIDKETMTNCIVAIGSIGPEAGAALPMLTRALGHRLIPVKRAAAAAIQRIEGAPDL